MTNSNTALREKAINIFADIFTAGGEAHEVGGQSFDQLQQSGYIDRKITDLTALISEHYVSREEYDEEKKSNSLLHKAMVTAEKGGHDKAMEEISEHYYPKEFVEWMIKNEVFMGFPFERNNEGKLILSDTRDMTTKSAVFTTDELFNYWVNNKK